MTVEITQTAGRSIQDSANMQLVSHLSIER